MPSIEERIATALESIAFRLLIIMLTIGLIAGSLIGISVKLH